MAHKIIDWFDDLEEKSEQECSKLINSVKPVSRELFKNNYGNLIKDYLRVSKYLKACESLKESLERRLKESPDINEVKSAIKDIETLCEQLKRTIDLLPDSGLSPLKGQNGKMVSDSVLSAALQKYDSFKNSNGYREVFNTNTKTQLKNYMKLLVQSHIKK